MARQTFSAGDVSGLYEIDDTDHLYPAHINELRKGAGQGPTLVVGQSLSVAPYIDIQTALNALPAIGGEVFLQEGTYLLNQALTIPNNVRLRGVGLTSVIKIGDGLAVAGATVTNSDKVTGENIELCNFKIDGNAANNGGGAGVNMHGLQMHYVTNLNVHDIMIYNTSGHPIDIANCTRHSFINNLVTSPNSVYGSCVWSHMADYIISNNHIWDQHGKGIGLYGYTTSWGKGIVANNVVEDCGFGIYSVAKDCIIANNQFYLDPSGRAGTRVIDILTDENINMLTNVIIKGNYCYGGLWNGIYIGGYAERCLVEGNIVENCGQSTESDVYRHGILINDLNASGKPTKYVNVLNNIVYNSGYGNAAGTAIGGICHSGFNSNIQGNLCLDNQGIKTQDYGIIVDRDANHIITGNNVLGNLTGGISHPTISTNIIEHNQE